MELKQLKRLMKLNIFIYGMRSLGVEITKNIVLAGLNKVIIYDPNISKINDSSPNFYLSEEDVESGKRRDETVIAKLSSLNS